VRNIKGEIGVSSAGVGQRMRVVESGEVKTFKTEATMNQDELATENLSNISSLLGQIYPYSFKAQADMSTQRSLRSSETSGQICDNRRSHAGYIQVHTQLPTGLASELQTALSVLGYSNVTEWVRAMARETIREATRH